MPPTGRQAGSARPARDSSSDGAGEATARWWNGGRDVSTAAGRKCQPARTPLVGPHTLCGERRAGLFIAHVIALDSRRPSFVCPLTRAVPQLDEVISGKKPCPVYTTEVKSRQQMSTRDLARTNARVRVPPCPRVSRAPYISGAPLAFPLLSPSDPHSHPHLSFRRARGR